MKKLLFILPLLLLSCKKDPEFMINGKQYYTEDRCLKDTTYTKFTYRYGYNTSSNRYENCFGPESVTECLIKTIDTIEIK